MNKFKKFKTHLTSIQLKNCPNQFFQLYSYLRSHLGVKIQSFLLGLETALMSKKMLQYILKSPLVFVYCSVSAKNWRKCLNGFSAKEPQSRQEPHNSPAKQCPQTTEKCWGFLAM